MVLYEIWDGNRYRSTVMPSEDLDEVISEEGRRCNRLHVVKVENGKRSDLVPVRHEDYSDEEYGDEARN